MARPVPVLPDVGSMIVPPGRSRPSRSAASTSRIATRSLIDPPGLKYSTFATICGVRPAPMRLSRMSGVSPTVSRIESLMSGSSLVPCVAMPRILRRRDLPGEMRLARLRVVHGEALALFAEDDGRAEEERELERDVDAEGLGQAVLERGEAARLEPHAVGDRALQPEGLGPEAADVDRVAVAGDGGVAAADAAVDLPPRALGQAVAGAAALRGAALAGAPQIGADVAPCELAAGVRLGDEVELRPALGLLEAFGADREVQRLADAQRPVLRYPVADVDEPDDGHGEPAVGHQLERVRECEDVRVGRRQLVAQAEAAHPVVGGDVVAVGLDPRRRELALVQRLAARPRQQAGDGLGVGEPAHAPI